MTKLEPNSMPSSKNMWAQPMSDLSINPMGYQYSPMYGSPGGGGGGGPIPRHNSSYPHMPAGTGVPQQPSGKFLAGPGESDRSPPSSSSSSKKKAASQGKRQSIQQQPQPQQQTSPSQMMMQDPSMAMSMDHMSKNNNAKPAHSYSYLITTAIQGSPNQQMTLNDIYEWVMEHYPWYKTAVNGWKNSIRHNLSLNKAFRREPRPPSEPGKGSYWRLDPEHKHHVLNEVGAPVPGGGSGMSRSNRSSRRSSAGQRGSSSRGSSRRATSDPTPHPPAGAPIPEIPLTPVPVLPKRPGHETDPYVFKIETHPTPTIIPTLNTSTSNRRHSHLLSHDHAYTSPQEQLQHIEQQHQGYGTMNSQFSLSGLNTQPHHHGGLFSPTSPTGPGPNNDYGYQTSMYSQNAPNHLPGPGGMMDSSGQDSRFSNQGFYFPQNGGTNPGTSGRPLSIGSHNNGHYDYHSSHSYSAMNQNGSAGAPFYTSSPGYGLPSLGRTPSSGGNTANNNSPPNSGGSGGYAGPPSYRSFHDYGNNNGSEYGSNGHSRASSMMSLSSPVGSFMGAPSTSSSSGPYPIPQSSFGSPGGNSSGMLSPISPPSLPTSSPTTPSTSSGNNSMRQAPGSIAITQEAKGQVPGGGNTMRSHPTW